MVSSWTEFDTAQQRRCGHPEGVAQTIQDSSSQAQGVPEPGAAQRASGRAVLWDQVNDLLSLVVGLGDGDRLGSIRDSHQQAENVGP